MADLKSIKKITKNINGQEVGLQVESAIRDGQGNVISDTYSKKIIHTFTSKVNAYDPARLRHDDFFYGPETDIQVASTNYTELATIVSEFTSGSRVIVSSVASSVETYALVDRATTVTDGTLQLVIVHIRNESESYTLLGVKTDEGEVTVAVLDNIIALDTEELSYVFGPYRTNPVSERALMNVLKKVALTGSYNDLTDKPRIVTNYADLDGTPNIPAAQIQSDWNQTDTSKLDYIKNKPILGALAAKDSLTALEVGALPSDTNLFSGNYNDLTNKPTIPTSYNDLTDKVAIVSGDEARLEVTQTNNTFTITPKGSGESSQWIEFGATNQLVPSASLVVGGIFFEEQ